MSLRAAFLPALAVVLAACSGGPPPEPPAPPPLDPTGVYDVMIEAQGQSITGVMSIEGSAEAGYTGSVDTEMGGAAVTDIQVVGQEMTFSVPEAGVQARLIFEGDGFTGGMTGGMGDALIFGTKRTGGS